MIRLANENDIPHIMEFIDKYWRHNHILSKNRIIFEFQYKWDNEISFVVSEQNEEITGVLGFIPYDSHNRDITLALWKTNKTNDTMQGIKLLSFLREDENVKTVSCPGINPKTIPIYKFLGLHTGKMEQWYRLRRIDDYKIAKVLDNYIPVVNLDRKIDIIEIKDFSDLEGNFRIDDCLIRDRQLIKSKNYLKRRYFEHPVFKYIKYGVKLADKKLFVVLKIQECNGSSLLRVIDCIGDHEIFRYFTPMIDKLLIDNNCEYIDCYETGVDDVIFEDGGWIKVANSGNIIPEYFAPFEQRNIDIYYMSEIDRVILFKGDGDMDRPS